MTSEKEKTATVLSYLPHRYPFLLVDAIESINPPFIVCKKLVSYQEPVFQGHFPGYPVFPGVMTVEASAQASGILLHFIEGADLMKNKLGLFAGIDEIKFKKAVLPGDILMIHSEFVSKKMGIYFFKVEVTVDSKIAMKGSLRIILTPAPEGWSS